MGSHPWRLGGGGQNWAGSEMFQMNNMFIRGVEGHCPLEF